MLRRNVLAALAGLCALLARSPSAEAKIGTIDNVPAATLLLPYFEVDFADPAGFTTLFSVGNASATPAVAHLTLWTDLGFATAGFDLYLTGYDVATVNLRDLFTTGLLQPAAGSANTTGPASHGVFSQAPPPGFPECQAVLTAQQLGLSNGDLRLLQARHTGFDHQGCFSQRPAADSEAPSIARGYLTIDNANRCSGMGASPADRGPPYSRPYFARGGKGVANNRNQLWGDYFYVDGAGGLAVGETLVAIEADDTLPDGGATFYRTFSRGRDQREALPSHFRVRFADLPGACVTTELVIWRDPIHRWNSASDAACFLNDPKPFAPCVRSLRVRDENGSSSPADGNGCGDPSLNAPALNLGSSGRIKVLPPPRRGLGTCPADPGEPLPALDVPVERGSLELDLRCPEQGCPLALDSAATRQGWVTVILRSAGRFAVAYDALAEPP